MTDTTSNHFKDIVPLVLNLRHFRVGPKLLASLQKPKYRALQQLCLGPKFASATTLEALLCDLPPQIQCLDLDLTRFSERRSSGCGGRASAQLLDWNQEIQLLLTGLPPSVTKLCLRFPPQSDNAGILALAQGLPLLSLGHTNLMTLDLRGNHVNDKGATALAKALTQTPIIQHLILGMNAITSAGAAAFAKSLNSTNLKSLDLSHNSAIDDAAVEAFSLTLQQTNCPLEELNLVGCFGVANKGIASLLECLKLHNCTIQYIYLKSRRPVRHDREQEATDSSSSSDDDDPQQKEALIQEMEYWLSLNRGGRRLIQDPDNNDIPMAVWPLVLARKKRKLIRQQPGPDPLFFLLRQTPKLFDYSTRPGTQ